MAYFVNESFLPEMKVKKWSESPSVVPNSLWPHGLYCPWHSPGQNTGVGSLSLLQGIFQTQGLNIGLLHCTWILYQLSQKWSPRILVWVTYPSFRGSSQPRNPTRVSCIAGGSFTNWATREAMREKENFWQKKTFSFQIPTANYLLGYLLYLLLKVIYYKASRIY